MYALVALLVIRTIAAIAAKDTLIDAYVESKGSGVDAQVARDGAPAFVPTALISLVIFGGLLLVLAYFFCRRAGWARITAIVLGVLGAIGGVVSLLQPAPLWYQLLGVLSGLLSIAVVVMLLRPDANAFYARH